MSWLGTLASCILLSIVAVSAGVAQGFNVDWKFYGGASLLGESSVCFYDAKGVAHAPDGHIRVWTKCLPQENLNSIDNKTELGRKIINNAVQKMIAFYRPSIANIDPFFSDKIPEIITYEEAGNVSYITPHARIFYELNCSEQMLRELSVYFRSDGKSGSRDKPGEWKYQSPGGSSRCPRLINI
jgi:hypothetical protein